MPSKQAGLFDFVDEATVGVGYLDWIEEEVWRESKGDVTCLQDIIHKKTVIHVNWPSNSKDAKLKTSANIVPATLLEIGKWEDMCKSRDHIEKYDTLNPSKSDRRRVCDKRIQDDVAENKISLVKTQVEKNNKKRKETSIRESQHLLMERVKKENETRKTIDENPESDDCMNEHSNVKSTGSLKMTAGHSKSYPLSKNGNKTRKTIDKNAASDVCMNERTNAKSTRFHKVTTGGSKSYPLSKKANKTRKTIDKNPASDDCTNERSSDEYPRSHKVSTGHSKPSDDLLSIISDQLSDIKKSTKNLSMNIETVIQKEMSVLVDKLDDFWDKLSDIGTVVRTYDGKLSAIEKIVQSSNSKDPVASPEIAIESLMSGTTVNCEEPKVISAGDAIQTTKADETTNENNLSKFIDNDEPTTGSTSSSSKLVSHSLVKKLVTQKRSSDSGPGKSFSINTSSSIQSSSPVASSYDIMELDVDVLDGEPKDCVDLHFDKSSLTSLFELKDIERTIGRPRDDDNNLKTRELIQTPISVTTHVTVKSSTTLSNTSETTVNIGGQLIDKNKLDLCNDLKISRLVTEMMVILFTSEEMGNSSLTGKVSNIHSKRSASEIRPKKQLDPIKIKGLYGEF